MKKTVILVAAVILCFGFTMMAQAEDGSWTGYLSDENCAKDFAKSSSGEHAACATSCVKRGAHWALSLEDSLYVLDIDAETAEAHAGHHVTIKGTMDGETKVIKVSNLEMVKH